MKQQTSKKCKNTEHNKQSKHTAAQEQEFQSEGRPTLWHTAVTQIHGWWGHILRHPDKPAAKVATWRSVSWWRIVQSIRDPRDAAGRHPRRGWRRGSEELFEQCFGDACGAMAADRARWAAAKPVFLQWCVHRFGGALQAPPPRAKRPRRS